MNDPLRHLPARLERRRVEDLRPSPRNPHRHGDDQVAKIARSIEAYGFNSPVLIDPSGEIVAGEARWLAARRLGRADVPVIVLAHLTPAQREAYRVADNRLAQDATWDDRLLAAVLSDLYAAEIDLAPAGFDDEELARLLEPEPAPASPAARQANAVRVEALAAEPIALLGDVDDWSRIPGADEDEASPAPLDAPVSGSGDCWRLDDHRVACGDSSDAAAVAALFAGERADFVFTSPPYNVGVDYAAHDDAQRPWSEYGAFLVSVLRPWLAMLPAGRFLAWNIGSSPKTHFHRQLALIEGEGLGFYRSIVWKKIGVPVPLWHNTRSNPVARNFHPNFTHEFVFLFARGKPALGGPVEPDPLCENDVFPLWQGAATRSLPAGAGKTGAQLNLDRRSEKIHPAAFPPRLPRMFMSALADVGAIVADPFLGSGSTLMAAARAGRRCYGMELSPLYCDVAVRRWQMSTGRQALLAETGERFAEVARRRRVELPEDEAA